MERGAKVGSGTVESSGAKVATWIVESGAKVGNQTVERGAKVGAGTVEIGAEEVTPRSGKFG